MPQGARQRPEIHAAYRFAVQIDGVTEAVFTECTLPTLEVEIHEQQEGGLNNAVHQIPGRIKSGKITLKHGITATNELLQWYAKVASGQIDDSRRNISVIMYDSTATEVLRWDFEKALPTKWTGPSFVSGNSAVAIETLELSYHSIDIE